MSKKKKSHSKSSGGSGNKNGRKPEYKKSSAGNIAARAPQPEEEYSGDTYGSVDSGYEDTGVYEETAGPEESYYGEDQEEYYGEEDGYSYDGDGYADGSYGEEGYGEGDYGEEEYAGEDYGDENYGDEEYAGEDYGDENYGDEEYAGEDYGGGRGSDEGAPDDSDSIIPEFLRPFAEKCRLLLARMERFLYRHYIYPDEGNLVSRKTTITAFSAAAAAAILLGFGLIIFLGTYPFHTTGMKTKDFVREFNAITSDTDIRAILPNYSDVTIPEKAKLGREPIYLAGGHVKLTAKTRFGKIIEVSVEGVDIPNYDPRHYSFKTEIDKDYDPSNDQFYYYIALGKTAIAAEKLLGSGPFLSERNSGSVSSGGDLSSDGADDAPLTVYEAASYGYQLYYYAYYYYSYRTNSGYVYMPMGKCYMNFTLSDMTLVIRPTIEKITTLPDGLQRFWDKLTGASGKTEEDPSAQTVYSETAGDSQPDSDTAASDSSLSPAA